MNTHEYPGVINVCVLEAVCHVTKKSHADSQQCGYLKQKPLITL
jgi:hypothetical protein